MENPIKMDDLGGTPYFRKHPPTICRQKQTNRWISRSDENKKKNWMTDYLRSFLSHEKMNLIILVVWKGILKMVYEIILI